MKHTTNDAHHSSATSNNSSTSSLPQSVQKHICETYQTTIQRIRSAPSAQHQVWMVDLESTTKECPETIVVRHWQAARTWWNLHYTATAGDVNNINIDTINDNNNNHNNNNHNPTHCPIAQAARAEIASYRLAGYFHVPVPRVLSVWCQCENENHATTKTKDSSTCSNNDNYWALLEYIDSSKQQQYWKDSMISIRHEYGFDEPHPRWGRVPVDEAPRYAQLIVDQIVLPLHQSMLQQEESKQQLPWANDLNMNEEDNCRNDDNDQQPKRRGYRYHDMVRFYRTMYDTVLVPNQRSLLLIDQNHKDEEEHFWQHALTRLDTAISHLDEQSRHYGLDEASVRTTSTLPPCVLCHMDLQPQNILFHNDNNTIVSVLDWEEAAYADPRFEFLLLCRKVLANRTQAQHLWEYYQTKNANTNMGPLGPWLQLETVHSLVTLMLQACSGNGRNPWETAPDLRGKIYRELQRLETYAHTKE